MFINSLFFFQLNKKLIEAVNIGGTENVIKGKKQINDNVINHIQYSLTVKCQGCKSCVL